ncbi:MAG: hypothetical protein KKB51_19940 [Candidatus Riflebacteria bacterium]|nr:hypothetical protein [Candidatus Riflebacteria bacterium]
MVAFFLQLFTPIVVFAQDTQKAQIQQAIDEFQGTYDEIEAVKEIELGSITSEILRMIENCENYIAIPRDDKGITTPEQSREWAAKMQAQQEKAKLEGYLAQIEKANKDIAQIKWDAWKTMNSLKNGSLEEAAKTDPTKVYNSLDKNASALAVYQDALKGAGDSLLAAAAALENAAMLLGFVTEACVAISATVALAPFTAPIAAITGPLAGVCSASALAIKIAGESLIAAADNAITSDEDYIELVGNIAAKEGLEYGRDYVVGKVGGKLAGAIGTAAEDMWGGSEFNEGLSNLIIKELVKPTNSSIDEMLENNLDEMNKHISDEPTEEEKIMMPAFIKPQLNWD